MLTFLIEMESKYVRRIANEGPTSNVAYCNNNNFDLIIDFLFVLFNDEITNFSMVNTLFIMKHNLTASQEKPVASKRAQTNCPGREQSCRF